MNYLNIMGRIMGAWLMGVILFLSACTSPLDENHLLIGQAALNSDRPPEEMTRFLIWGDQHQQIGFRPQGAERRAEGASSVAVGPQGEVYLLDRLNRRVLQVRRGDLKIIANVPVTAEELAVGPTGTLAVYSPLHAWVRLFDDGVMTGQIRIPRVLRQIRQIGLGASRLVSYQNAYQETLTLGTPSMPQRLETVLHSRRKGAFFLPDGTGVAARLSPDARPEVLLLGSTEKSPPKARFILKEKVLAARIVGVTGQVICLRLELEVPGESLTVVRRAVCLDARDGQQLLNKDLSHPGLYVPRIELTLGGSPPRLAFIKPEREGLQLTVWTLDPAVEGRGK